MRRWGIAFVLAALVSLLALVAGRAPRAVALPPPPPRCDLTGEWSGDGDDDGRTQWTWTLTLRQTRGALDGAFTWHGTSGSDGVENVHGWVSCPSHRFRIDGRSLAHPTGGLVLGDYRGTLDASFTHMSGYWTHGVPGRFRGSKRATP